MQIISLVYISLTLVFTPISAFAQNPFDQMRGMIEQLKKSVNQPPVPQQQPPAQQSPRQAAKPAPPTPAPVPISSEPQSYTSADLETAWACRPVHSSGIPPYFLAFTNADCRLPKMEEPETRRLIVALMKEYQFDPNDPSSLAAFDKEQARREKVRREQELRAQEIQKQNDQMAKEERQRKLKTGAMKITSIDDAKLFYAPFKPLHEIMESPLLSPDDAIYSGNVVVDLQEKPGVIRGKIAYGYTQNPQTAYVYLQSTKATVNFSPESMRIGGNVQVLGRYIQNVQYQTVAGTTKTAPVVEVLYFGQ